MLLCPSTDSRSAQAAPPPGSITSSAVQPVNDSRITPSGLIHWVRSISSGPAFDPGRQLCSILFVFFARRLLSACSTRRASSTSSGCLVRVGDYRLGRWGWGHAHPHSAPIPGPNYRPRPRTAPKAPWLRNMRAHLGGGAPAAGVWGPMRSSSTPGRPFEPVPFCRVGIAVQRGPDRKQQQQRKARRKWLIELGCDWPASSKPNPTKPYQYVATFTRSIPCFSHSPLPPSGPNRAAAWSAGHTLL